MNSERQNALKYQREASARHYAMRRDYLDTIKSQPCLDCSGVFPSECMDFDHIIGEKLENISHLINASWDRLLDEISKCDLVCSNCHRIRTRRRQGKVSD